MKSVGQAAMGNGKTVEEREKAVEVVRSLCSWSHLKESRDGALKCSGDPRFINFILINK